MEWCPPAHRRRPDFLGSAGVLSSHSTAAAFARRSAATCGTGCVARCGGSCAGSGQVRSGLTCPKRIMNHLLKLLLRLLLLLNLLQRGELGGGENALRLRDRGGCYGGSTTRTAVERAKEQTRSWASP